MNLKDVMAADNSAVFINADEFAEIHDFDGVGILAVVDSDELSVRSNRQTDRYDGLYKGTMKVYVRRDDLGYRPEYGQALRLDNVLYLVAECYEDHGMLTVLLEANIS